MLITYWQEATYPHMIGSLERMIESIDALGLPEGDRAKTLAGNAARMLGI